MKFRYSARTKTGELQAGYVDTINRETALETLLRHDLYVLTLEASRGSSLLALLNIVRRARRKDLLVLTRQFAAMLEGGIPLPEALRTLYLQTRSVVLKEVLLEISLDIEAGHPLSFALERHSQIFSEFYISLIRSAEATGRIDEALVFLAEYLEKEVALLTRIRGALLYPALVLALFVAVAAVLVAFVFPTLEPLFREASLETPAGTRLLLGAGAFLSRWWLILLFALAAFFGIVADYFRTIEGKMVRDELLLNRVPVIGTLLRKVYLSRFVSSASILLRGGIPIAEAIEIAGRTIVSPVYRELLGEAAAGVRRGEALSVSLARAPRYFPPLVVQMTAVGEATGKMSEMLDRVATFYTREIEATTANLVELLQPAIILVIGAGVGLLFGSVLLPIYNLVQQGF